MKNTKKIMGAASVFGAIIMGAALYLNALDNPTYFRGLAPATSENAAQEYGEEATEEKGGVTMADFANIKVANKRRIRALIPQETSDLRASTLTLGTVASPCKTGEHAIVKNGVISGCAKDEKTQSCESLGKVTYTGPDKPGLLFGMCL